MEGLAFIVFTPTTILQMSRRRVSTLFAHRHRGVHVEGRMDQVNAIENTLKEIMAKIDEITELLQKEDSTKTIELPAKTSNLPKIIEDAH
jgi:hypothetical protein